MATRKTPQPKILLSGGLAGAGLAGAVLAGAVLAGGVSTRKTPDIGRKWS